MQETDRHLPFGDGPVPLWFWQDEMPEREIAAQLNDMKDHGITECFVIYPVQKRDASPAWLSDKWFAKVKFAIETARALGMKIHLHDEHGYPSGAVGGLMVECNPDFQGKHLAVEVEEVSGPGHYAARAPDGKLVRALAARMEDGRLGEATSDLTGALDAGAVEWQAPPGQWQVMFFLQRHTD